MAVVATAMPAAAACIPEARATLDIGRAAGRLLVRHVEGRAAEAVLREPPFSGRNGEPIIVGVALWAIENGSRTAVFAVTEDGTVCQAVVVETVLWWRLLRSIQGVEG